MTDNVKIEHLSFSSLSTLLKCGEEYRLKKIEGETERPGWSLIGGSAVHNVTAALDHLDYGIDTGEATDFQTEFTKLIEEAEESSGVPRFDWYCAGRVSKAWPHKENEDFWRVNGPVWVDNWRQFITRSPWPIYVFPDGYGDLSGKPAIELDVSTVINGIPIKGFIDRLVDADGKIGVVDLKTGANMPAGSDQLDLYRLLIAEAITGWGAAPSWGAFFDARNNELTPPTPLSGDRKIEYLLGRAWDRIERRDFLPSVSSLCKSCGVRDHCVFVGGSGETPWIKEAA